MKKVFIAMALLLILFIAGCQEEGSGLFKEEYDPSIHNTLINQIRYEFEMELPLEEVEDPITITKLKEKEEYKDRGKVNVYVVTINLVEAERTRHDLWYIAFGIDQLVSKYRLAGEDTSSEGIYKYVHFTIGDSTDWVQELELYYKSDEGPKKTYNEYMITHYDEFGEPGYHYSYQPEYVMQWIHQL